MFYKQKKHIGKALFLVLVLELAASGCGGRQMSPTKIGQVASLTPITKVQTIDPASEIATEIPVILTDSPVPPATATTVPTNSSTLLPTATVAAQLPTDITLPPGPTAATITAPPTRAPPSATPAIAILSFNVEVQDIAGDAKRLTFTWVTTGAANVAIISGTSAYTPRTAVTWSGPPNGAITVELHGTGYRNPGMTLLAYNSAGNSVSSQTIHIEWLCKYEYFFLSAPPVTDVCPAGARVVTVAVEQSFEHGRMIWLKEISANAYFTNAIFILYDDQRNPTLNRFDDQWTPGEPENDPAIVPPAGLYQPVRGFGKLWRENEGVRNRLGWALAPEQSFDATWQFSQPVGTVGDILYLQMLNGQTITLWRWTSSSGEWLEGTDIK